MTLVKVSIKSANMMAGDILTSNQ